MSILVSIIRYTTSPNSEPIQNVFKIIDNIIIGSIFIINGFTKYFLNRRDIINIYIYIHNLIKLNLKKKVGNFVMVFCFYFIYNLKFYKI